MSDFDKEAERERLREKYEHEEQKREVTERMSELLLKGATMTNAHCQDCGDPIFRYDGQEFCATCQRAVERETDAADADEETDAESNGDREEIEVATPSETGIQFGGDEADPSEAEVDESEPTARGESVAAQSDPQPPTPDEVPADAGGTPLRTAHESLSREVARLAQQAEASEDLGQKRALLNATREAAEALEAVRQTSR